MRFLRSSPLVVDITTEHALATALGGRRPSSPRASLMRVGTRHLGSALLSGVLVCFATPRFPEKKGISAAVRLCSRLLHETCGLVPMAAAGELVAAASADGQHSADD
jgi:hypothetical protein